MRACVPRERDHDGADDDGELVETSTEGSWESGVDGALPGIVMQARPRRGQTYRQEYLEGEAEDMAKVVRLHAWIGIDLGWFRNCLVTKEWTPLERGVVEFKAYAPGVGLVLIREQGGKRIELVEVISPDDD